MTEITWFGHSAFRISCGGKHLFIDPFFTPASTVTAETCGPADVVLVTHDEDDIPPGGEVIEISRWQ